MAKAQAALRRAQSEYDKIAWAGQVGETPQAIQLEQFHRLLTKRLYQPTI